MLWPISGLLKQIINHNRSKFVLSKLVLSGVTGNISVYVYAPLRVHFIVCTWSVNVQNFDNILLKYECQIFLFA